MTTQTTSDPRVAELLDLAATEGRPLALRPEAIVLLEDDGACVDPFSGAVQLPVMRWLTPRGKASAHIARRVAVALLIALVTLASLAPTAQAETKTCWRIANGRICYVNGHFYSISCNNGYRVDPPGSGHRCIKVSR